MYLFCFNPYIEQSLLLFSPFQFNWLINGAAGSERIPSYRNDDDDALVGANLQNYATNNDLPSGAVGLKPQKTNILWFLAGGGWLDVFSVHSSHSFRSDIQPTIIVMKLWWMDPATYFVVYLAY